MTSAGPLRGDFAARIQASYRRIAVPVTLTREIPGGYDPVTFEELPPTIVTSEGLGMAVSDAAAMELSPPGLVITTGQQIVMVLANSITVEPKPLDRVSVDGRGSLAVTTVHADEAGAFWWLTVE